MTVFARKCSFNARRHVAENIFEIDDRWELEYDACRFRYTAA